MRSSGWATTAAALLTLAACADLDRPVAPRSVAPSLAISDDQNGGREGFYFRPPIAPSAVYPGTFDATLLSTLSVDVCPIDGVGTCTGPAISYTESTSPAIVLNALVESYELGWKAPAVGSYRAVVKSGATSLGFFDIEAVATGASLSTVPAGFVGVVRAANLPIKFRIETDVVASVSVLPAVGFTVVGGTPVQYQATVTNLHGAIVSAPGVSWSSSYPSIATVDANGLATGISEGPATIFATGGGVTGSAAIEVRASPGLVVGNSTVEIPRDDACGNTIGRTCESLIGDVVADAMRVASGVDFAIVNSGTFRADLTCPTVDVSGDSCNPFTPPPHPITRGQVSAAIPFDDRITTAQVNGAELKVMLENGVSRMPFPDGRFPQVSGLCVTYDISAPASNRVVGVLRQAADGSCTGASVDLTTASTYTIVENDFMASGGDGYPNFTARITTGDLLDRIAANYIAASSPISPTIQGRIACVSSSGSPACPVVFP